MVPPNKKHKPNESITSLYSTILNSISKVSKELEPLPSIPTELINKLDELMNGLEDFQSNLNHSENSKKESEKEVEGVNLKQFKDKLDQEGAYFWNKSVAAKCHEQVNNNIIVVGGIVVNKWEILHAKCKLFTSFLRVLIDSDILILFFLFIVRLVAFNLVSLGSVDPLTVDCKFLS